MKRSLEIVVDFVVGVGLFAWAFPLPTIGLLWIFGALK